MQTIRELLGSVPFFAAVLKPAELDALAARAMLVDYPVGAKIIREDEPGASMFVIVSGEVAVTSGKGRTEKHVAHLGGGTIVGEMSLMTGARRSATVTATKPVKVLEIRKGALEPILAATPALVDTFAATLQRRQEELDALYGAGRLQAFGFGSGNFGSLIRGFFGGAY